MGEGANLMWGKLMTESKIEMALKERKEIEGAKCELS